MTGNLVRMGESVGEERADILRSRYPEMLLLEDAAEALECHFTRVVELLSDGTLPGLKIGRGWVIPRQAFFAKVSELAVARAKDRQMAMDTTAHHAALASVAAPRRRPGRPRLR